LAAALYLSSIHNQAASGDGDLSYRLVGAPFSPVIAAAGEVWRGADTHHFLGRKRFILLTTRRGWDKGNRASVESLLYKRCEILTAPPTVYATGGEG